MDWYFGKKRWFNVLMDLFLTKHAAFAVIEAKKKQILDGLRVNLKQNFIFG